MSEFSFLQQKQDFWRPWKHDCYRNNEKRKKSSVFRFLQQQQDSGETTAGQQHLAAAWEPVEGVGETMQLRGTSRPLWLP